MYIYIYIYTYTYIHICYVGVCWAMNNLLHVPTEANYLSACVNQATCSTAYVGQYT